MDASTPRYLGPDALAALGISTNDAVESIEHLIRGRVEGRMWNAPKSALFLPDSRFMMATLAAADDPPFVAVKSLVLNPRNPGRGEALINSLVTLLDSETGRPVALLDGNWVTAIRTAALSTVAAKRLARPDSTVAAFIGCGVQARSHLLAFADTFPLREIRALGRGRPNQDALCRMGEEIGLSATVCRSAREAVDGADLIISSVTSSRGLEAFVDARWLALGSFAAITDIALPWVSEGMAAFDRIVIDDLEQESAMPQPMVSPPLVLGDIAGLVNGDIDGRQSDSERAAFVFRGLALGDLALAALAYRRWLGLLK
jgi:ornithine cyclodeaminase/alanine dehydrogenase-like protein (mu-crystallin family)